MKKSLKSIFKIYFLIFVISSNAQTSPPLMERLFGATTANAVSGNQGLTIALSKYGEVVNLKWPLPNYYDHLNYKSLYPLPSGWQVEQYNKFHNAQPRQGSFVGIQYTNNIGVTSITWLKNDDWTHTQNYKTDTSPIIVTDYYNAALQLTVKSTDFVIHNQDSFVRKFKISWANSSLIQNAKIVFVANMAPCNKNPNFEPNQDWVTDQNNGFSNTYFAPKGQFVSFIPNLAAANVSLIPNIFSSQTAIDTFVTNIDNLFPSLNTDYNPTSLLTAKDIHCVIGANRNPISHGMESDYGAAQTLPTNLIPNGQSTSANAAMLYNIYDLNLANISNEDEIVFQFAFGPKHQLAQNIYDSVFAANVNTLINNVETHWQNKLASATIPQTGDVIMQKNLKRILINTLVAINRGSGSIGSSVCSSQPAYSQQWVRDAAIMGYMLDTAGYTQEAQNQALFFKNVQRTSFGQDCQFPANNECYDGTWSQCYYADGRPSWAYDFEIDEAGWGVWMLYAHSTFLSGIQKTNYLNSVYPAIKRGANFLKDFKDNATGLQLPAREDDVLWNSQTIYGAATTLMGLKAALNTAQFLNDDAVFQIAIQTRITELELAIETHKWGLGGNQYDYSVYGNYGGRSIITWPTLLHDVSNTRMIQHTESLNTQLLPFFNKDNTSLNQEWWYVGKALCAMAYMWKDNPVKRPIVENYLEIMLKEVPTQDTYSYGETNMVRDFNVGGTIVRKYDNRVGQPSTHPAAWIYMTAQILYGINPPIYLGLKDFESSIFEKSIVIYPNPNNGNFNIKFSSNSNDEIKIKVNDTKGILIYEKQFPNSKEFNQNLFMGKLQTGIYFITIINGNMKVSKRIIVK
jgi:Secretion system C-terminal sorting domain